MLESARAITMSTCSVRYTRVSKELPLQPEVALPLSFRRGYAQAFLRMIMLLLFIAYLHCFAQKKRIYINNISIAETF
jgi:hypothetical protein